MDDLELRARLAVAEAKVSELTVRLRIAQDTAKRYRELHRRRRVPVVLEVEPTGDVTLYAEQGTVELGVVGWPRELLTGAARDTVEEWLYWQLDERHRGVYLPSCVEYRANGANCQKTLTKAYEDYENMLVDLPLVKALVEASKHDRKHFERKQHAPKKTTNARAAAEKRRARGVE